MCFVHKGGTEGTAFLECMCNGCACGRNSSVAAMSSRKAVHSTDMGVSPWCSKGFLSQHQIQCRRVFFYGVRTAPVCSCIQDLQPYVHKNINKKEKKFTGSHSFVWTQENTAHTHSAALAAAVLYQDKMTQISHKGQ